MKKLVKDVMLRKNILVTGNFTDTENVETSNRQALIGAILNAFGTLGYTLDIASIERISNLTIKNLTDFYSEAKEYLCEVTGAKYNNKTVLYPEFPDVNQDDESERYYQFMHYFTVTLKDVGLVDEAFIPNRESKVTLPFSESVTPKILTVKFEKDVNDIVEIKCALKNFFYNSFENNKAINNNTLEELRATYNYLDTDLIPSEIPFKENIMKYFLATGKSFAEYCEDHDSCPFIKTATDYLRLYKTLSDGSTMFVTKTYYSSFPRNLRKWFLRNLNNIKNISVDDFDEHYEDWIYVFENLHPGDYAKKFPRIYKVAYTLRSKNYTTWRGNVEAAITNSDTKSLVSYLVQRPGVFARKIDELVRNSTLNTHLVLNAFKQVVNKISLNVLLQLRTFYQSRIMNSGLPRIICINKETSIKSIAVEDTRADVSPEVVNAVIDVLDGGIADICSELYYDPEKATKIFLEDNLKNYLLPTNERSASAAIRSIPTGSKIKLEGNKEVIRLFTHWKNIDTSNSKNSDKYDDWWHSGRVDIDLAAHILDNDFNYIREVSWRSHYRQDEDIKFSGDITDAPNGANEFIDINVNKLRSANPDYKYIVITNSVYTGQAFSTIPECYSGVMFRDGLETGELFEPSTVQAKFNLTQDSTQTNIACVINLDTYDVIYIDKADSNFARVAGAHFNSISDIVRRSLAPQLSMFEYLVIAFSRNDYVQVVDNKEEADIVVGDSEEATIHPWNQEEFVAAFMPTK